MYVARLCLPLSLHLIGAGEEELSAICLQLQSAVNLHKSVRNMSISQKPELQIVYWFFIATLCFYLIYLIYSLIDKKDNKETQKIYKIRMTTKSLRH